MAELRIDVETLAARLAAGERPFLLDVREPWEFDLCRLDGSVNLPLGQLQDFDPAAVGGGQDLIVICHHGMRSLRATLWLRGQGLEATNLDGGVDRWAAVVEPDMARY
ncbi:rhodanese-like domain-containing protein [Zavarzinia compransoris]|uniref:Sulfurtransferase n=1 Tax=Zavarzinia compransoris TaxID=1264899 RepID=A0A317E9V9_9PROT|nr:rhodanese-like domain-containing protein [Zavarzinia compransoris]PWR23342.1 sulfurtransferase [Zavarzinia compransoris]TDP46084.1 rhodanese-related sulfurtransferase [Zavarzinia compransoris]